MQTPTKERGLTPVNEGLRQLPILERAIGQARRGWKRFLDPAVGLDRSV